jgi:hypothetical protein
LFELHRHSTNLVRKLNDLFERMPIPAEGMGFIDPDPEAHSLITSLLSDAASAKNLLADYKRRDLSGLENAYRAKRTAFLRSVLDGIDISTLLDKSVRNSVEHFDEYLDKANIAFSNKSGKRGFGLYNLVLSSLKVLEAMDTFNGTEIHPLKIYVADQRTYYNFEAKVDLGALLQEAQAIVARVEAHMNYPDAQRGKAGGGIIPLGNHAEPAS